MKVYKCKFCSFTIPVDKQLKGRKSPMYKMGEHYDTEHKDMLPPEMDGYRFFYFLLRKMDKGSCIICKKETVFNRLTMKYSRFCTNPKCKEAYREQFKERMVGKYGKIHLLDDPQKQQDMQSNRRIAGIYKWSDGKSEFGYLGSYELDFLKYLDLELKWPVADVLAPSPHVYKYEYGGKERFYMPDFFIPSLNLEIEIKDDGSAKNINEDSRKKDVIKHELMLSLKHLFNYIKIINKNYDEFNEFLKERKE